LNLARLFAALACGVIVFLKPHDTHYTALSIVRIRLRPEWYYLSMAPCACDIVVWTISRFVDCS